MRQIIAALVLVACVSAQIPPPLISGTGPLLGGTGVGSMAQATWQPGSFGAPLWFDAFPGECMLTAYCHASDAIGAGGAGSGGYGGAVRHGGVIYFEAQNCVPHAFAPALPPLFLPTYYQAQQAQSFFLIGPRLPPTPLAVPGGAPYYDQLFLSSVLIFGAQEFAHSPPWRKGEVHVMSMRIPPLPALAGMTIDTQAFRVDPLDGQIYLSSVWSVLIA